MLPAGVVHRQDESVGTGQFRGQSIREMRRERSDATAARQMIAEHGEPADLLLRIYDGHRIDRSFHRRAAHRWFDAS